MVSMEEAATQHLNKTAAEMTCSCMILGKTARTQQHSPHERSRGAATEQKGLSVLHCAVIPFA
jgi:hypothetical protein